MRALLANYIMNRAEPVKLAELNEFTLSDTVQGFYTKAAGKPADQISLEESVEIRPMVQKLMADAKPHDHFIKTHSQPAFPNGMQLIEPSVSLGAIYIARNPMDLVFSYAEHFGMSVDLAIRDLGDEENTTVSPNDEIVSYLGSWSGHVTRWTESAKIPVCAIRYEDLLGDPQKTFGGVLKALRIPVDDERLARAIRHASFKSLSALEKETGFAERSPHADKFFRSGTSGEGAAKLSKRQIKLLKRDHGAAMEKLGYHL